MKNLLLVAIALVSVIAGPSMAEGRGRSIALAGQDDAHGQERALGTDWHCWSEASSTESVGYLVYCDR